MRIRLPLHSVWIAALASFALAGCGVADYEKKMLDAEARIQRFDEDDRLLGAPLTFPSDPAPPFDVYLRPPKGVASMRDPKDQAPYHFTASKGVFTDMVILFGSPDDGADGKDKLKKQIEDRLSRQPLGWQPIDVHPPEHTQAISFDAVEFNDATALANAPALYIAYVHQPPSRPAVGVLFHLLQSNRPGADVTIKRCLETYAEGGDAVKARAAFSVRMTH